MNKKNSSKYYKVSFESNKIKYFIDLDTWDNRPFSGQIQIDAYTGEDEDAYSVGSIQFKDTLNFKSPKKLVMALKQGLPCIGGFSELVSFSKSNMAETFVKAIKDQKFFRILEVKRRKPRWVYEHYSINI